ncbi:MULTISPECIES: GNAT family N-acetyltransferase [Bacillus]|uniref:GNAT family N-acetyltransferase n=1 Tax=Bacillus TaxID=1386 RepID=UPI00040FD8A8|nr:MULTISPECIES: GNAT family N-acetyltransferase [Bacillus]QHZ45808.1 GNAT family N-acetyltransferase [Bacillus sp. NSP9.1]WFA04328.1 GNAT family N-acetyltransferase [Bacillus sp. HSf4]
MRDYFLQSKRIGFSLWSKEDMDLANVLWGDPDVTAYISSRGRLEAEEVKNRLQQEIEQYQTDGVQYFPIFAIDNHAFIGCCGLRPYNLDERVYEIGFHLVRSMWHKGYASEAAKSMIDYAYTKVNASKLFAGHHPENQASRKLLNKLGFRYTHDEFYPPTGLHHPSYILHKT